MVSPAASASRMADPLGSYAIVDEGPIRPDGQTDMTTKGGLGFEVAEFNPSWVLVGNVESNWLDPADPKGASALAGIWIGVVVEQVVSGKRQEGIFGGSEPREVCGLICHRSRGIVDSDEPDGHRPGCANNILLTSVISSGVSMGGTRTRLIWR